MNNPASQNVICYNCHSKSVDKKYGNGFWNIALIRRSTKTTRML